MIFKAFIDSAKNCGSGESKNLLNRGKWISNLVSNKSKLNNKIPNIYQNLNQKKSENQKITREFIILIIT